MKTWLKVSPLVGLGLVLWLAFGAEWEAMRGWLGRAYLILFAVSTLIGIYAWGKIERIGLALAYLCSKLSGILLLCWLRWGCHAEWMSGGFGLFLIVFFGVAYVIGLIVAVLNPRVGLRGGGE